ncbi:MAG: isochorismatase family protein [Anaerolineae bacterium]|jgi:nicotinamidase-related amidase
MRNKAFLDWLYRWEDSLPSMVLEQAIADPARVAVVSEDLLKGFCDTGPLASQRSASIVPAAVGVFHSTYDLGVQHFLLLQDTHRPEAVEFSAYPPHCIEGTEESETISELRDLPFSDLFTILPKNSISSNVGTKLEPWLAEHPGVNTFIVLGVCTDICVYHAAIYLRVRANVRCEEDTRVIVPANAVQTFDTPVDVAEEVGAMPHDGDLLHRIFLYQMALNGVEVVASIG